MPETHDLGRRWYWGVHRYPDFRRWEVPVRPPMFLEPGTTREIEEPFRTGHGWVIRAWPTRWALVIGRWSKRNYDHETVALEKAMHGRNLTTRLDEIREWPGGALDDDEGIFADTPGVISWREPADGQPAAS